LRDKGVVKDPPGLDRSIYHVERGGMFYDFNERLRSASRLWGSADDRVNYVGFRVVRGPFQNENQPRRGMI
jgi:formylglycine-generating enzyme required for sulfatase activity